MTHIRMSRDGAIGTITIDRVERFNSLDVATARDLRKAALQYARDDSVAVVVLAGAGGVFCSGADLKYIAAGGADPDLAYLSPGTREIPRGFGEVFKQILEYLHSTISEIRRASIGSITTLIRSCSIWREAPTAPSSRKASRRSSRSGRQSSRRRERCTSIPSSSRCMPPSPGRR